MNRQQFVQFDSGLIVTLDNLISFKEDSRETDSTSIAGKKIPQAYGLKDVAKTVEQNTYHKVAIETVANDVSANGHRVSTSEENFKSQTHKDISDYIESLDLDLVAYEAAFEYRLYGQVWIEILKENYDGEAPISGINVLQGKYMYKTVDSRVYMSQVNGKIRYFKKFGYDSIDVNYLSGEIKPRGQIKESERASEVYFQKSYNPNSIHYGLPIAVNIITAIVGDLKRGESNLNFFLRGGVPKYLITISGNFEEIINRAEYEEDPDNVDPVYIDEWLEEQLQTIEAQNNPNSAMVLTLQNNGMGETPINVDFQQVSSDTGEASHREYRTDNRDEILAAHQVPVYRLGIAETGSLGQTNIVEQNKIYNRKVVKPLQSMIEKLMKKVIAHQYGSGISAEYVFKFNEIDLEDNAQKIEIKLKEQEFLLKEFQAGVISLEMYLESTGRSIDEFENSIEAESQLQRELDDLIKKLDGIEE